MSHSRFDNSKKSHWVSQLVGPAVAGVAELPLFHPSDTVAKRLQKHKGAPIRDLEQLKKVMFADAYGASFPKKVQSLYSGIAFASGYKVLQRAYRLGGQQIVKSHLKKLNFDEKMQAAFGNKIGNIMLSGTAGSIIGVGEVLLLPLDALKVRMQTNVGGTVSLLNLFKSIYLPLDTLKVGVEGEITLSTLFKGAKWTAARNVPGSFALFSGAAAVKEAFGLKNYNDATLLQETVASTAGAIASLTVSNPLDVVKTRIQASGGLYSGSTIFKNMLANESLTALGKGLVPKLITTTPKLAFTMTFGQMIINEVDTMIQKFGMFSGSGVKTETAKVSDETHRPGGPSFK